MSDRELLQNLTSVLRPLARKYVSLTPDLQVSLHAETTIRVDYLRDAYLALKRIETHLQEPVFRSRS